MRPLALSLCIAGLSGVLAACAPEVSNPDTGLFGFVLGADASAVPSDGSVAPAVAPAAHAGNLTASGRVSGSGAYQLFDLGPASVGERLVVAHTLAFSPRYTVVLFDGDYDLLTRSVISGSAEFSHVIRRDSAHVYLGVMPSSGSGGGDFRFGVRRAGVVAVPPPQTQVVWLNFAGGSDVRVNGRGGISFAPFGGADLGAYYTSHTERIKASILRTMREDYAPFNVTIVTSDEGPAPAGAVSIVHFGGSDSGLLGLADNVDRYNLDKAQNAIIYVETFASYWTMRLDPDEMGQMIGNVASHELGHLLGLYHNQDPAQVMDSTGGAWDLAGTQVLGRGHLEPTVFAVGNENAARILEQTVGPNKDAAVLRAASLPDPDWQKKLLIRQLAHDEILSGCGTCLAIDDVPVAAR